MKGKCKYCNEETDIFIGTLDWSDEKEYCCKRCHAKHLKTYVGCKR